MVETYRLHPNAIKNLARYGQGYLLSDQGLRPVAYGMLPPLSLDYALPRNEQPAAKGLRLYETFVASGANSSPEASRGNTSHAPAESSALSRRSSRNG